jgi:hypothetical protein
VVRLVAHVRCGSKADIGDYSGDVRFTPESGHWRASLRCPLSAISGLMQRSKKMITLSAVATSDGAIVMPRAFAVFRVDH